MLTLIQRRVASIAVGPSTVRGQGPKGMVHTARRFLATLDLEAFSGGGREQFEAALESTTNSLRVRFPRGGRHWGTARKVVNIFLRDATYNHALRRAYRLARIERWLELPLDGIVARRLQLEASDAPSLRWRTVKGLDRDLSARFQSAASKIARKHGFARVHLDLMYWRQ